MQSHSHTKGLINKGGQSGHAPQQLGQSIPVLICNHEPWVWGRVGEVPCDFAAPSQILIFLDQRLS